jgi:hypothetical protein
MDGYYSSRHEWLSVAESTSGKLVSEVFRMVETCAWYGFCRLCVGLSQAQVLLSFQGLNKDKNRKKSRVFTGMSPDYSQDYFYYSHISTTGQG